MWLSWIRWCYATISRMFIFFYFENCIYYEFRIISVLFLALTWPFCGNIIRIIGSPTGHPGSLKLSEVLMSLLYAAYFQLDEDNSPFLDDLIEIDVIEEVNDDCEEEPF